MDNFEDDFNRHDRESENDLNSYYRNPFQPYNRFGGYRDDSEFSTDFFTDVNNHDATSGAIIAGIVGIISSLVALFIFPIVLGIAAIGLGGFSVSKGNKTMGYLSIAIGILALITPILYGGSVISLF